MPNSPKLTDAIERQYAAHYRTVEKLNTLKGMEDMLEAAQLRFGGEVVLYSWGPYYQWTVSVKSFKEVAPMIEFVEGWTPLCLEVKRTSDEVNTWRPYREYHFLRGDIKRLVIEARIPPDGEDCVLALDGFTEAVPPQPKYKFVCKE